MVDYYSILSRAVTAPGAGDAQWRRSVYDRARQLLVEQLQARRPPPARSEIAAELRALDAAAQRIEAELARDEDIRVESKPRPKAEPRDLRGATWIALAVIVAAIFAGSYAWWATSQRPAPPSTPVAPAAPAPRQAEASAAAAPSQPAKAISAATEKDGDLKPGVDGGSSEADLSYVLRRQPTFYRTLQPVGTIIVDKSQHFLYLIQPNNVALRYGIGLGHACDDLAGLRHIASKAEWPPWQPTPEMIARKLAKPGTLAGGPGNPLGARLLALDDNTSSIHGTNAPKTIGTSLVFGCIRLVNDDIVDLANRVQVATPVVVN